MKDNFQNRLLSIFKTCLIFIFWYCKWIGTEKVKKKRKKNTQQR